jgi:hypothetical protein
VIGVGRAGLSAQRADGLVVDVFDLVLAEQAGVAPLLCRMELVGVDRDRFGRTWTTARASVARTRIVPNVRDSRRAVVVRSL